MNKFLLEVVLIVSTLLFTSNICWGQVTIGNDTPPVKGALLQLKENENTGANSTKGLLLPRVKLTDSNSLQDLGIPASENLLHAGMMIFNTNDDLCKNISKGVSLWTGEEWTVLGTNNGAFETDILKDNRDGDVPQTYHIGHFKTKKPNGEIFDAGWWTLENMRATKYDTEAPNASDPILLAESLGNVDYDKAFYIYPKFDTGNDNMVKTHGYYYSSRAMYNGWDMELSAIAANEPPRIMQGVCPNGWRLPTYEDWINLLTVLYNDPTCTYGSAKPSDTSRLSNIMSVEDSSAGVQGTSRPLEQGGFNSFLKVGGAYGEDYSAYTSTYPVPYSEESDEHDYRSLAYILFNTQVYGIGNPRVLIALEIAPVRCVKGPIPPQVTYK